MKKIGVLIVFALSIYWTNAQRSVETASFEKRNLKPIVSVNDEQRGKVDKETGVLLFCLNHDLPDLYDYPDFFIIQNHINQINQRFRQNKIVSLQIR